MAKAVNIERKLGEVWNWFTTLKVDQEEMEIPVETFGSMPGEE